MTTPDAEGPDPEALRARARALLDLGRGDEGLEVAQRALVADPTDPETELVLARCHIVLEDASAAIRHAGRAGALDPDWALPHMVRARVLVSIGHRDEAERAARQALALAPDAAIAHSTLGVVLAAAERRPDEAWSSMQAAVHAAPDDADIRLDAASVALNLENWTGAEEHAQAALALRPDDAQALNLLGAALSHQNRPQDALAHLAGSARLDPTGVGPELARDTARQIAGTAGLDVRRIWLVLLASLGAVWTLALVPRSIVIPVLIALAVASALAWSSWRRKRREVYESLSGDERRLVDRARTDPSPMLVAILWTVLGVAAFIGALYLLQIVAPPADGETATPTQSAVVVTIAVVVMTACWWRLRQFRVPSEE